MATPEASIVKRILHYLNGLDDCYARKVHGGAYGTNGEPDLDICLKGRAIKLEVKAPGRENTVTEMQFKALAKWGKAGAIVGVVTSLEEVKELLDEENSI